MTGNKYLLYPGCSMESTAIAYDKSLTKVAEVLNVELEEINDWNCCGATEYFGISLNPPTRSSAVTWHSHPAATAIARSRPVQRLLSQPGQS